MKLKRAIYLLPIILLTSCSFGNLTLSIVDGGSTNNNPSSSTRVIEYFDGDKYSPDLMEQTIFIAKSDTETETDSLSEDELLTYFSGEEGIFTSFSNTSHVGAISGGLKIGSYNENVDGTLTISLSKTYEAVLIVAHPRISTISEETEKRYEVDEAAISVNDSKYIKLNNALEEDGETLNSSDCIYSLNSNNINIRVALKRAVIEKIILLDSKSE